MPALVALDALDALPAPGQRAVGEIVEQGLLPGVEDDTLEQHVVEAHALGQPDPPAASSAAVAGSRSSNSSSIAGVT